MNTREMVGVSLAIIDSLAHVEASPEDDLHVEVSNPTAGVAPPDSGSPATLQTASRTLPPTAAFCVSGFKWAAVMS